MENTVNFDNTYFQEKISALRLKVHSMDGFVPVEKISENVAVKEDNLPFRLVKSNEKESS